MLVGWPPSVVVTEISDNHLSLFRVETELINKSSNHKKETPPFKEFMSTAPPCVALWGQMMLLISSLTRTETGFVGTNLLPRLQLTQAGQIFLQRHNQNRHS